MGLLLPGNFVRRQREADAQRRKRAAAGLKRHATMAIQAAFPEHLFTVEVEPENGHILIDHMLLATAKARYFCRYSDYDDGKGAVKLAGEILERVGIKRGELKHYEEYDTDKVLEATKTQFNAR